ncbi:DUF2474 family protein [Rhizobium sp. S-51]|jgi:hypothetical protein|uniref:DUF2474 family protein n=1 Tax=Rhizobium terricola TaxID=2728849 RepID=A0A7Y0FTT5_9HYPH|nr:DUF2474 family protein [Rhizobium terricola]NML72702.1 DUF2474 family protein [Rhizobium terricola]
MAEKLAKRLGWFAGLWLLGVLSVGAVAMVIKLSLGA